MMRIRTGLAIGLLAVVLTGCGGGDDQGVATAGGPSSQATSAAGNGGADDQDRAVRFGRCMRANGVPSFPDPKVGEGGMAVEAPEGVEPKVVDAAMQKCRHLMPGGGVPERIDPQRVEQLRKYAQCMRANGVPKFPDPGPDGGLKLDGNDPAMRPSNPTFAAAEKTCAKHQPGAASGDPSGLSTGGNR